ncbi:hypothetical protein C6A37_00825 [Desulfobacteraceae bacterium SEEP-SAG9]|nr:hypothetical protein C6A37_00825 [Desulfobacteraceae bacterium SEEP-SAG9]
MRAVKKYSISKESLKEMQEAKRFNPCLEITFRDKKGVHRHKLSAGYDDHIYVYREQLETSIMTQNHRLGYVGLEVFAGDDKTGDIFLEAHQVLEELGKDDLAPFTIAIRLRDYVQP